MHDQRAGLGARPACRGPGHRSGNIRAPTARRRRTSAPAAAAASSRCRRRPGRPSCRYRFPRRSGRHRRAAGCAGATSRTRAPIMDSSRRLDRATRLCSTSPQMATTRPSKPPSRRRMVRASSSAWVGCSWAPSPALMTLQSSLRDRSSAAPASWWRTTRMSGRMAFRVRGGVDQGLALGDRRGLDAHVHHIGAQPLARQLEDWTGCGWRLRRTG